MHPSPTLQPPLDWAPLVLSPFLSLSPPQEGDEFALVTHLAEPDIARTALRIPFPYTHFDARNWIRIAAARSTSFGKPLIWAIRDASEQLIGCIGYEVETPASHKAELGYWLAKPWWGQGIMTTVVSQIVTIGLAYGWTRLSANVFDSNLASARVLEKCGFILEAHLKKLYYKGGQYIDAKVYAIVR